MSFDVYTDYTSAKWTFGEGIDKYLALLKVLGATKRCGDGWIVPTPKSHDDDSHFDPMENPQATHDFFLERFRQSGYEGGPPLMFPEAYADGPGAYPGSYQVEFKWNMPVWTYPNLPEGLDLKRPFCAAKVAFPLPHPKWGMEPGPLIEVVKALVAFRPAQHVALYFWSYRTEHWPVDITRRAIGWIGWVPFPLTQRDVPEAARVEALGRGALIVTNEDYWTPHENPEALARAQAVDRRLNLLGVLPTADDLARGDWGQP